MTSDVPTVEYWHAWTDPDGISHQERRPLGAFALAPFTSDHEPIWVCHDNGVPSNVVFLTLPANQVIHWHENPVPQWIAVLSGRWFVETMDGTRVEMGPGELSFGGDQGTDVTRADRGHQSGALDGRPCSLMLVQLSAPTP